MHTDTYTCIPIHIHICPCLPAYKNKCTLVQSNCMFWFSLSAKHPFQLEFKSEIIQCLTATVVLKDSVKLEWETRAGSLHLTISA